MDDTLIIASVAAVVVAAAAAVASGIRARRRRAEAEREELRLLADRCWDKYVELAALRSRRDACARALHSPDGLLAAIGRIGNAVATAGDDQSAAARQITSQLRPALIEAGFRYHLTADEIDWLMPCGSNVPPLDRADYEAGIAGTTSAAHSLSAAYGEELQQLTRECNQMKHDGADICQLQRLLPEIMIFVIDSSRRSLPPDRIIAIGRRLADGVTAEGQTI